jgi:hypothetical protein
VLRRRWVLLAAVALVAAAATTAHAANLALTGKTLFAMKSSADAVPAQLVYDTFTNTSSGTLNARLANTGQPWQVVLRTLRVTLTQARCSDCSGSFGSAVIDADLAQVTATVQLRKLGTGTPGGAGLVLNANPTGTQAIVVLWDNGVVRLYRYTGGTLNQRASATAAAISTTVDTPLVVTHAAGSYSVSFNNVSLFSYTLTPGDLTALGPTFSANTYFGVGFRNDPDRIRLDNFEVKK